MSGPAAAPAQRTGRSDPCPCGSGRDFEQCCGAAHPVVGSASPPRGARPDRLNFGPLSEAGKLREAAEALSHAMHGIRTIRPNAGNAAGAGHAPPVLRQTEAAQRYRRQGVGLAPGGQIAGRDHRAAPGDPARPGGCRIAPRARPGIVAQRPPRRGNRQLRAGDRRSKKGSRSLIIVWRWRSTVRG